MIQSTGHKPFIANEEKMPSAIDSRDFPFFLFVVAGFLMLVLSVTMLGILYI